tara:strand:- start:21 stop:683 length:663 start_codon:yes stop_codon:yes gene_type:complete
LIRFFDIFFSTLFILLLTPFFFIIAIFLKFTGEGEIFFLQKRVGIDEKLFKVIKFVTMLKESPHTETGSVTIKNDPRILKYGNFLRKTKINELPQLINILLGDMSFIGPRPLTLDVFNKYPLEIRKKISKIKPGLSGIGSIYFRNEENFLSSSSFQSNFYQSLVNYKGRLEMWYIDNISIKNYFYLIALTIIVLFYSNINFNKIFLKLPKAPKEIEKIFR